jgi:glucose uptake protein GlcU
MTEDEIEKADELHMEGKAVIGVVAIVLLIVGLAIMLSIAEPEVIDTDRRHMWLDGMVDEELKNTA